jgi:hydroxymethylpyrimidine/phosphomethylpyrimidine kinase
MSIRIRETDPFKALRLLGMIAVLAIWCFVSDEEYREQDEPASMLRQQLQDCHTDSECEAAYRRLIHGGNKL